MVKTESERHQRSKVITASNVIGTIMLCIFVFDKVFLLQSQQSSHTFSRIDAVSFLVIGLSLSVSMALYGYQAWILDLQSFTEWYSYQHILANDMLQNWYNNLRGWNLRSQYRLMAPIGFIAGLGMTGFGLFMLMRP